MSTVTVDPGAEIARIATQNIATTRIGVDALHEIALLQNTSPLAAEIAVRALREIKDVVAPSAELRFLEHYTGVLEEAERDA